MKVNGKVKTIDKGVFIPYFTGNVGETIEFKYKNCSENLKTFIKDAKVNRDFFYKCYHIIKINDIDGEYKFIKQNDEFVQFRKIRDIC